MLKPALLSKEGGLTRIFMNLKLHRFMYDIRNMPDDQLVSMIKYMKNASSSYKNLWFQQNIVVSKTYFTL